MQGGRLARRRVLRAGVFWSAVALSGNSLSALRPAAAQTPEQAVGIFSVSVSPAAFNPARGESVRLTYNLARAAAVTVKVFGPDLDLVRMLADAAPRAAGSNNEVWDGRDLDGRIVPDEAWLFTIEALAPDGSTAVYDPVTFSGGEQFDLQGGRFDRTAGSLTYRLPQPSRVLVRIGIRNGALLNTLVDWQPRLGGEITEPWNGRDASNVIDVWEREFATLITYFTLPEASVISYGNPALAYRAYKRELPAGRPKKPERPMQNTRRLSPGFLASRLNESSFALALALPDAAGGIDGVPVVRDRSVARIDVAAEDGQVIRNQRFEILLYLDGVFIAEEERGYLPYTFPMDLGQVAEGVHVLTVNVATVAGQMGTGSLRMRLAK